MADPKTRILSNDALTRKKWARDLFSVILPGTEFNYLTGTGKDAVIQINTDLSKGEGEEVTFGIRLPLTGTGRVGYDVVEGYEEKINFRNFKMTIEELNHAVDTGGRMEEQRIPYDLMKEGKDGLQEWWISRLNGLAINTLVGNSAYEFCGRLMSSSTTAFAQVISEPTSNHHMFPNGKTSEATITAADTIDLSFLDAMKQRAEIPLTNSFKLRPLALKGKSYFRVLMHNYMFEMLRQNTNPGQWGDLRRAAGQFAMPEVEIEYNGMLVTKSEYIPRTVVGDDDYSGVYRCVLLGAQSAVWAWGGAGESKSTTMAFVPYTKDAERFVMIRGGGIFGMKAVTFPISGDYGRVVGSLWAKKLD